MFIKFNYLSHCRLIKSRLPTVILSSTELVRLKYSLIQ